MTHRVVMGVMVADGCCPAPVAYSGLLTQSVTHCVTLHHNAPRQAAHHPTQRRTG